MSESLADKIAGILTAAPATFDPEDDVHEETAARVEVRGLDDDDEEPAASSFRKQNIDLLGEVDKRYDGKKSSRKKLLASDDWDSDDEGSLQNVEEEKAVNSDEAEESSEQDDGDSADGSESDFGSDTFNTDNDVEGGSLEDDSSFKHMKSSSNQLEKGVCVRQQLSMWESLLEIRIQLQKCLMSANKLPQNAAFMELKAACGAQFTEKVAESKVHVRHLLDKLLLLQLLLLRKYPETKNVLSETKEKEKTKIESDEEIPSDTEDEQVPSDKEDEGHLEGDGVPNKKRKLNDYGSEICRRHTLYKGYRNSVIQKWNDKTRGVTNKSGSVPHSVVNHIDHILSDRDKLVKRTQLKRADYNIVGDTSKDTLNHNNSNNSLEEYNADIFDDTDFYHHLLRELIEFKSSDLTDPVQLSRQWIQLQNLRSKMKRKIDTKATKGRKIRYVVHSKLVNFMAPLEEMVWQEEAKSELFNSLFGKNRPVNTISS